MLKPHHELTCEPIGRYGVGDFFQAALGPTLGPSWIASAETDQSPNPIRVNGPSLTLCDTKCSCFRPC